MKVKFVDLVRQMEGDRSRDLSGIKKQIEEAVSGCIDRAQFIMGPEVEKFEREFADYCGTKHCISLNSGTDAVEFALRARGLPKGNVITVPNSYFTTASSILEAGHEPRFVDVDPITRNMDPIKLLEAIDSGTRAIIPVHMYGQPADMERIMEIASARGIDVIEDCAHAHGAMIGKTRVPYSGEGAFSFFPAKNLGALGDAGALVTNSRDVAERSRLLRNDGASVKYHHDIVGRKARMDTIQAAVLSVKLPFLNGWNERRRILAGEYSVRLSGLDQLVIPSCVDGTSPVFHVYQVLADRRDELKEYLGREGIETNVHYPIPIHLQKAMERFGIKEGSFPISEDLARRTLSLPMFPELSLDELGYVCDKIKDFYSRE